MSLSTRGKILVGIAIIAIVAVSVPLAALTVTNANSVRFTLLNNAGVMIEAQGVRVYVDPFDLPESYGALQADVIMVTHPHGDHYDSAMIDMLQKEGTVNIFPENMTDAIALHDGVGVNPEDELQFGSIQITAFYMYTFPVEEFPASHPIEANWTSYIITVGGVTFFHAGDSKHIDEYSQLTGLIDVALLPLGPGCQTMANEEIVDALDVIQPRFFVPIHYAEGANHDFALTYGPSITSCILVNLEYYQSYLFPP
ncbi:MAG: MBL fold metallo-hydrolase [Candidatus Hermodarchaeia archaeon]|jgi:L-ascorbate metabolism protein UlaG (beta-lactamase superfamily)